MKINFAHTAELNGKIEFVNQKGETVRTYPLEELEKFVLCQGLNVYEIADLVSGSGMPSDPNNIFENVESIQPVSEYLDEQNNFVEACEAFYKAKNPHEFKSFNHEQETIRRVGQ